MKPGYPLSAPPYPPPFRRGRESSFPPVLTGGIEGGAVQIKEGQMSQRQRWRTTAAIQQRAQDLRRDQTPAERQVWACLRGKQLGGFRFRHQHPIGPFIVDFCCLSPRLVIEIDGDSHAEQVEYDASRTAYLAERGYAVICFTNEDVQRRLEGVLAEIVRHCEESAPFRGSGADRVSTL